ncbi:MAG: hypothetical protein OXN18_14610 [Gemmatimonadota bacterium]|nr:hypothetical protein [Gemmatimonadota bacterium]
MPSHSSAEPGGGLVVASDFVGSGMRSTVAAAAPATIPSVSNVTDPAYFPGTEVDLVACVML